MAEQAHLLRLNNFNMPVVFKDQQAAYVHIVYLILLEPGKFQSHPRMGVGLRSKWRFYSTDDIEIELQAEIDRQIKEFLPSLDKVSVNVSIDNNHELTITIDTRDGVYEITYDRASDQVKINNNDLNLSDL